MIRELPLPSGPNYISYEEWAAARERRRGMILRLAMFVVGVGLILAIIPVAIGAAATSAVQAESLISPNVKYSQASMATIRKHARHLSSGHRILE